MLGLAAVPSFIQGVWMFFMPESQRWLAKKEMIDRCKQVLSLVYPPEEMFAQHAMLRQEVKDMRVEIAMSEC